MIMESKGFYDVYIYCAENHVYSITSKIEKKKIDYDYFSDDFYNKNKYIIETSIISKYR